MKDGKLPRIYAADLEKDFTDDPSNANKGTVRGRGMLAKSIGDVGAGRSLVVDRNGLVVAGNKTREALNEAGMKDAIVVETDGQRPVIVKRMDWDLTDRKSPARRYAYLDNRVAEVDLEWDQAQLAKDLASGEIDMTGLFSDVELKALLGEGTGGVVEDEVPPPPAAPKTRPGDMYQLGEHRLVCGDCTDAATIARLVGAEKADMTWTDPPWNVGYGKARKDKKHKEIANDDMGDEFGAFADAFCKQIAEVTRPGGALYMAMSAQEWPVIDRALRASFHWSSTIIWAKDSLVLSRKDYHTQYEPIWYGWRDGQARICPLTDRKQSDLWQIDRPKSSEDHPTMKPVGLVARAIVNSSMRGHLVFEPFCGSGTTLIACEQTGRRCVAIELDPGYCDVIVRRWEALTGKEAVLVGPGAPALENPATAPKAASRKKAKP